MIDGALNLLKPTGMTSAKAVYRVRRITGIRKSGHAGSLDPGAHGVLVVLLGGATRLTEAWMDQPKVYEAVARLDVTSSSFDADRPLQPVAVAEPPSMAAIDRALAAFEGRIDQVPPAVSAVKVGGRRAYRLERAGESPTLAARSIHIYWIRRQAYEWPELRFTMACGRGTYVRALIRDLGIRLGTGGCLMSLCRTAVGPFEISTAWSFERLEEFASDRSWLVPLDAVRQMLREPGSVPSPINQGMSAG